MSWLIDASSWWDYNIIRNSITFSIKCVFPRAKASEYISIYIIDMEKYNM